MKRCIWCLALCAVFGLGFAAPAMSAEPVKLLLAHSATPENSLSVAYDKFAELVKAKTKGSVVVEVHGNGVLAGDQTAIDGVKMGLIDLGSSASNNMASYTTAFWVTDLPFIFKSIESSHKVWWGEIGEEMKAKAGKDINARVLFFIDTGGGFRVVANNQREVKVPADLKGLKLRATGSPIELAMFKAWGASGTPLPWPEVYTALEQKVINGESLHPVWIYQAKHFEALKHLTRVDAMSNVHVCMMSHAAWKRLSPEQQAALVEAGKETQVFAAQVDAELGRKNLQDLKNAGLSYYEPTPEEAKLWRDSAVIVWKDFADKVPQELIDRVLKAQE